MKGKQYYTKEEVVELFKRYVPLIDGQSLKITDVDINEYRSKGEFLTVEYESTKELPPSSQIISDIQATAPTHNDLESLEI